MIYQRVQQEYVRLEEEISRIRKQLQEMPAGKLVCCNQPSGHQKWYQSDGGKKHYIPKKNGTLAKQLAFKKFLSAQLEDMENEHRAIGFYLRHHLEEKKAEKLLAEEPFYTELLATSFTPLSQSLTAWMREPYEKNPYHPELLVYKIGDLSVRSKSEAMIVTELLKHHIPFRYECALQLGAKKIFPDFTIRHPKTGAVYYWEHFGMMDNPDYVKSACAKVQLYASYNMIPSIHLLTTYETKNHPLTPEFIEKVVAHYFL